jgi:hypothetical protein
LWAEWVDLDDVTDRPISRVGGGVRLRGVDHAVHAHVLPTALEDQGELVGEYLPSLARSGGDRVTTVLGGVGGST